MAPPNEAQKEGTEQDSTASTKGQDPAAGDGQELSKEDLIQALAAARKDAAKHRRSAREYQGKLDSYLAAEKAAEDQAALERGEHEKLISQLRATEESLKSQLQQERLTAHIQRALGQHQPKPEALADILILFPRDGLEVDGGTVEGLEDRLKEFKAQKPHLFVSSAPASGLPGYRPTNDHKGGKMPITEELRRQAERRGMPVEWWRDIQEEKARRLAARAGS